MIRKNIIILMIAILVNLGQFENIEHYNLTDSKGVAPDGQVIELHQKYKEYTGMIDILTDENIDDSWITILYNDKDFTIIDNR